MAFADKFSPKGEELVPFIEKGEFEFVLENHQIKIIQSHFVFSIQQAIKEGRLIALAKQSRIITPITTFRYTAQFKIENISDLLETCFLEEDTFSDVDFIFEITAL